MPRRRVRRRLQAETGSAAPLRMSYSDFCRHYSRIEVCTLTPDAILDDSVKRWSVSKFDGTWRRGSTAGGCRNHPCGLALATGGLFVRLLSDCLSDWSDCLSDCGLTVV